MPPRQPERPRDAGSRGFPGRNLVTALRYKGRNLRYAKMFDVLRRHCQGRVLDVGGGSFVHTAVEHGLAFSEWTVVEPVAADLPTSPDPRVRAVVGDGQALEFADDQFDTVLSVQTLEHVFEPIRMIEELYRVTKPGGRVVVMVPQTANVHHAPQHFQNFTRYWLDAAAEHLGAEVVEYHALGGAWSTIASRLLLQYPGTFGVAGYKHPGIKRSRAFWAMMPLGIIVSVIFFPFALLLSLADMKEEANNHLMVLAKR